jgi:hypothetical protein
MPYNRLGYPLQPDDEFCLIPTEKTNAIPWQIAFEVRDELKKVSKKTQNKMILSDK